jgi:hypothetical protein
MLIADLQILLRFHQKSANDLEECKHISNFRICNTLEEGARKENPTHIAVLSNPAGPTFRHTHSNPTKHNGKQPLKISKPPYLS